MPDSKVALKWESPNPIGEKDFSQPEYSVVRINPRSGTTIYREPEVEDWNKSDQNQEFKFVGRKISEADKV